MVGTICPVGNGTRSVNQRFFDSACYLLGATSGGLVLGAVLALFGTFVITPLIDELTTVIALSLLAGVAILVDFRVIRAPISPFPRQVEPGLWDVHRKPIVAARWGFEQGFGLLTYVSWAGFYVSLALTILVGMPFGPMIMGTFAAVRGSQPAITLALERINTSPDDFYDRFTRSFPTFPLARIASLTSVALIPIALEIGGIT